MTLSRRTLLSSLFAFALLAGCATLGGSKVITFSEADLSRLLEQHGPFQRRLLEVIDVRVQRPTVKLLPQADRLASTFDVAATERLSGTRLAGRLAIEYGLRYDAEKKAIRMTQVRVQSLDLGDVPTQKRRGVENLGALIAENMLDDAVLYRLRESDLKNAEGRGLRPEKVDVTARGVEITLVPIGR